MNPRACSALDPFAAGHALGSLDPAERRFVAAHLGDCGRPHPAVRESLAVAGAIGEALAAPCGPPSSLRAALLEAVRREPR